MADTATRSHDLRERHSPSPASADDTQNSAAAFLSSKQPALEDPTTTSTSAMTKASSSPSSSSAAAAAAETAPATLSTTTTTTDSNADSSSNSNGSATSRLARFQALQARAKTSARANLKEAAAESRRLATDTAALTALGRKHAVAMHNLAKADAEAAGEDFERKRAWDWTVDEAERWDRRVAKKARNRDGVAFADYSQEAAKTYKRQMREMRRDAAKGNGGGGNGRGGGGGAEGETAGASELEAYAEQKAAAVRRAAESGGLALVEDPDTGELVAIDRHGTFGQAEASDFEARSRPSKEGVDRLVQNLKKAEQQRLKNRKDRKSRDEEDGPDVTYINEKNKQFNMKLARFYNKYTADIRESFERGTMI